MQGGDKVDIKTKIRESGINQWEVAERVGVGEVTLVRWLRRPERLDAERLAKVEAALQQLIKERSVENG
jgi:transposase